VGAMSKSRDGASRRKKKTKWAYVVTQQRTKKKHNTNPTSQGFLKKKEKEKRIRQRRGRGITIFDRGWRKNKRWPSLSLSFKASHNVRREQDKAGGPLSNLRRPPIHSTSCKCLYVYAFSAHTNRQTGVSSKNQVIHPMPPSVAQQVRNRPRRRGQSRSQHQCRP